MLVIGIAQNEKTKDKTVVHRELDIDTDVDSPRKIHDQLKKEAGGDFETLIVVENDKVIDTFCNGEDYDLSEAHEMDDQDDADISDDDFISSSDDEDDDDFNNNDIDEDIQ